MLVAWGRQSYERQNSLRRPGWTVSRCSSSRASACCQFGLSGSRNFTADQDGIFILVREKVLSMQCCGSLTYWVRIRIRESVPLTNGFGSASGSWYFRQWSSRLQQQKNLSKFFCLLLFDATLTSFFKDKKSKKQSQNSRNQGFSCYFCLMIEGSGSGVGSVPRPNGSESGRPKSIRILRIMIRNADFHALGNGQTNLCDT